MNTARKPALLFDMDGVIVDSAAAHTQAWQHYLRLHGLSLDRIEQRMLGKHNDEIVREFFGDPLPQDVIYRHGAEKEKLYRQIIQPELEAHIIPGLRQFLVRYSEFPLGVASNAEPANVDFVLDTARLREHFSAIINGNEVQRPKPAPDIYLKLAERLRVRPVECVVFEDSPTGVAAARAAGMRVVGVLTSVREFPDADLTIRDFEDTGLEPWLRNLPLPS